ncbi:MAG: threonine/serine dehydratase [Rhizobiaceae bacterium]
MIPSLDHLRRAHAETSKAARLTPLVDAPALARLSGAARVLVKAESLQWAGSFKARGAYWRLRQLSLAEARRGVVAYSSGNFAQGLAASGEALGIPVTIVMPIDAPKAKSDATAAYGATVVLTDHGDRAREEVASARAKEIAAEQELTLLHPFDDPEIVAGQAGVGIEAVEQLGQQGAAADIVLCPVGGGGLIGGVSLAFHYLSPTTRTIGVKPEGFDGVSESLARGELVTAPLGAKTICDGLMARRPGVFPFEALKATRIGMTTVDDAGVRAAMKVVADRLKLILEPSGAATTAALLGGKVDVKGKTVVLIASGGNVALADFMKHVGDA